MSKKRGDSQYLLVHISRASSRFNALFFRLRNSSDMAVHGILDWVSKPVLSRKYVCPSVMLSFRQDCDNVRKQLRSWEPLLLFN